MAETQEQNLLERDSIEGLKGLPGISEKQRKAARASILSSLSSEAFSGPQVAPIGDVYNQPGVEYSRHDENITNASQLKDQDALMAFRSVEQSGVNKALSAIGGGVAGAIFTAIEDISYMLDFEDHLTKLKEGEKHEANFVAQFAKKAKEDIYSTLPIYENPETKGFSDSFFRWSTLRSGVDSMVGFAIPGGIVSKAVVGGAKALARAAKLAVFLDKSGKLGKTVGGLIKAGASDGVIGQAMRSVAGAIPLNYGEGTLMAIEQGELAEQHEIASEADKILKSTFDDDASYRDIAVSLATSKVKRDTALQNKIAEEQNKFKLRNTANILSDAFGLYGLTKGLGSTRNIIDPATFKQTMKNFGKLSADNLLIQGAKEGTEEVFQNVLQAEGLYQTRKFSGNLKEEDKGRENFSQRMLDFATSQQALTEGLMGFLSGGMQRQMMQTTSDIISGDPLGRQRRAAQNESYMKQQEFNASLAGKMELVVNADKMAAEAKRQDLKTDAQTAEDVVFGKLVYDSFVMGSAQQFERQLDEKIENAQDADTKQRLTSYKQTFQEAEKFYLRNLGTKGLSDLMLNKIKSDILSKRSVGFDSEIESKLDIINQSLRAESKAGETFTPISLQDIIKGKIPSSPSITQTVKEIQNLIAAKDATVESLKKTTDEINKIKSDEFQANYEENQKKINTQLKKEMVNNYLETVSSQTDNLLRPYVLDEKGDIVINEETGEPMIDESPENSIAAVKTIEGVKLFAYNPDTKSYSAEITNEDGSKFEATPEFLATFAAKKETKPIDTTDKKDDVPPIAPNPELEKPATSDVQETKKETETKETTNVVVDKNQIKDEAKETDHLLAETEEEADELPLNTAGDKQRSVGDWFFGTKGNIKIGKSNQLSQNKNVRRWYTFIHDSSFGTNSKHFGRIVPIPDEEIASWNNPKYPVGTKHYRIAIVDKNGKFLQENGTYTDKFDVNTSIYTSMTDMRTTYKDYTTASPNRAVTEEVFNAVKEKYIQFIENAIQNNSLIKFKNKTTGIVNKYYAAEKRPTGQVFDGLKPEDYEIQISAGGRLSFPSGAELNAGPGTAVIYNKQTGNAHIITKRTLAKEQVETISALFREFAKQGIKSASDTNSKVFSTSPKIQGIDLFDYLRDITLFTSDNKKSDGKPIYTNPAFQFHKKDRHKQDVYVIGGQEVALVHTVNGKLEINEDFFKVLEDFLATSKYNIYKGNIGNKVAKFRTFTYNAENNTFTPTNYENYAEYVFKEATEIHMPDVKTSDEVGKIPSKLNQYLRYDISDAIPAVSPDSTTVKITSAIPKLIPISNKNVTTLNDVYSVLLGREDKRLVVDKAGIWLNSDGKVIPISTEFKLTPNATVETRLGFTDAKGNFTPLYESLDKAHPTVQAYIKAFNEYMTSAINGKTAMFSMEVNGKTLSVPGNVDASELLAYLLEYTYKSINQTTTPSTESKVVTTDEVLSEAKPVSSTTETQVQKMARLKREALARKKETGKQRIVSRKLSDKDKEDVVIARAWLAKKLPGVKTHIVEGLIKNGSYGMFMHNIILIDKNAAAGTAYHEAFHAIFNLYLSPDERENLLKSLMQDEAFKKYIDEAYNLYPSENASSVLEEALAEIFSDYASGALQDTRKLSWWEKVKNFFNEIMYIIGLSRRLRFDNDYHSNILNAMEVISKTTYGKGSTVLPTSTKISRKVLANKDYIFTRDALEGIHHLFVSQLVADTENGILSLFGPRGASMIVETLEKVKETLEQKISDLESDLILLAGEEEFTDADASRLTSQAEALRHIIKNWNHNANKDGMLDLYSDYLKQYQIDMEVIGLTEESLNENVDENSRTRNAADNFGLDMNINHKLNATKSIKLMLSTLVKTQRLADGTLEPAENSLGLRTNVSFAEVFSLLTNRLSNMTADITEEELKTRLEEVASVEPAVAQLYGYVNSLGEYVNGILGFETAPEERSFSTISQIAQFRQTFAKNRYFYDIYMLGPNGSFTTVDANRSSLNKILTATWKSNSIAAARMYSSYYTRDSKGTLKYNDKAFISLGQIRKGESEQLDHLLNIFGIDFSQTTKDYLINSSELNELNYQINNIRKGNTEVLPEAFLAKMIDLELFHGNKSFENSHYNINGDRVYDNGLNSYLTVTINKLNQILAGKRTITEAARHLDPTENFYTRNSLVLKRILEGKGNPIKFVFGEGIIEDSSKDSTTYDKMDPIDRLVVVYSNIKQGKFNLLRPSDKSWEGFIDFGGQFISEYEIHNRDFTNVFPIFQGYLMDELMRSQDPNDNFKFYKKNKSNGIFIKLLLADIPVSALNRLQNESIEEYANRIVYDEKYQGLIQGRILKLLGDKTAEMIQTLEKGKVIKAVGNKGMYSIIGLALSSKQLTTQQLHNEIMHLVINDMIGNIEQTKLFYGDPALYKSMADEFKRHAGAVGTKYLMDVSEAMNSWIDKHLTKVNNNPHLREEGTNKPIIRTAVFNDVKVISDVALAMADKLDANNKAYQATKEKYGNDTAALLVVLQENASSMKMISAPYFDMTEGDGFGYITLDGYRTASIRAGKWNESAEKLYQWEIYELNETPINERVYIEPGSKKESPLNYGDWGKQVFNSLKLQYFGPMANVPGSRMTMYKLSVMPMLPSLINSIGAPNIKALMNEMHRQNTDIVVHYSANKGITTKTNRMGEINSFYDKDGNFIADKQFMSETDFNSWLNQDTYFEYWGVQQDTGDHAKNKTVWGTQMMKQVLNGIFDGGKIASKFGEDSEKVQSIVSDYLTFNRLRLDLGRQILLDKLGLSLKEDGTTYEVNELKKLVDSLTDEAIEKGLPDNFIAALDELRKGNISIDMLPNREKIETVLMGMTRSQVTSRKRLGKGSYQVPSTMFEKSSIRASYSNGSLSSSDLGFVLNEDGIVSEMEVYLPAYLKGKINLNDKLATSLIGFRIPTQYTSSIEVLRVKGFLPEQAGDIIIVPSEIVAKAGSDFDIDKMFIYIPNSFKDKEGRNIYIDYNIWEEQFEEIATSKIYNAILDKVERESKEGITIGEYSDYQEQLLIDLSLRLSDANDIDQLIVALEEMLPTFKKGKELEHYETSLLIQSARDIKDAGIEQVIAEQKALFHLHATENRVQEIQKSLLTLNQQYNQLIAPIQANTLEDIARYVNAINNNEYAFDKTTTTMDVLIDRNYLNKLNEVFLGGKETIGIGALVGTFHIMSQMYGLKMSMELVLPHNKVDDYVSISSLYSQPSKGEVAYIPDILNQIVTGGADVVKNPFMIDLNATPDTLNVYMMLILSGVHPRTVALFMNQPIIKEYLKMSKANKSATISENSMAIDRGKILKELATKYKSSFKYTLPAEITDDMLEQQITNPNSNSAMAFGLLKEFLKYQKSAQTLSEHIQSITFDTAGGGKDTSELVTKLQVAGRLLDRADIINFNEMMTEGFLAPYKDNLEELLQAYAPLFLYMQNNAFLGENGLLNNFINLLIERKGIVGMDNNTFMKKVAKFKNDYLNFLMMTTPFDNEGTTIAQMADMLLKGPTSIPKLVMELRQSEVYKNNPLLKALIPIINQEPNGRDGLKPELGSVDTLLANELTYKGWTELLNVEYKGVNIGEALIYVALLQDGFNASPMNFLSLAPAKEYSELVQIILENRQQAENMMSNYYTAFWAANSNDRVLVPKKNPLQAFSSLYMLKPEYRNTSNQELDRLRTKGIKTYHNIPRLKYHGESRITTFPEFYGERNFEENLSGVFYGSDKYYEYLEYCKTNNITPYTDLIGYDTAPIIVEDNNDNFIIKQGVEELFESNPELVNAIYESLGLINTSEIQLDKPKFNPDNFEATSYPIKINDKYAGVISVNKDGHISSSIGMEGVELEKEFQGKGYGTKVYIALAEQLAKEGKTLKSEAFGKQDINEAANKVWKSLLKKGYAIDKGSYFEIQLKDKQQAQQLYSKYLDTIFPESKVKDIVYHGADEKIEKFTLDKKKNKKEKGLFFFSKKSSAQLWRDASFEETNTQQGDLIYALLNIKNPETIDFENKSAWDMPKYANENIKGDGLIAINVDEMYVGKDTQYAAFEPEQIHILGSKQDIEGFKEFVNKPTFDKELARKIQDKLQTLYPEIKLNITNNPVWEQGDNIFNQEEYNNQVNYRLKATEKVLDNLAKIKQWESNKSIDQNTLWKKIGELGIPKQQIDLLKESKGNTIEEKLTSFIANYSYTVEINTAKEEFTGYENEYEIEKEANTQHYSNLTVLGGTNYTENEISTPLITPSIKGHAEFSTDKGIGWFRSDEQATGDKDIDLGEDPAWVGRRILEGENKQGSKTRRILEIQSDLFQKGRDRDDLIKTNNDNYIFRNGKPIGYEKNKFLQLLNKDNNWVTFFIKSIIQDSAKKGYEKVLFPKGETAAKIEGHQTIADEINTKNEVITQLKVNRDVQQQVLDNIDNDTENFISGKNKYFASINTVYTGIGNEAKLTVTSDGKEEYNISTIKDKNWKLGSKEEFALIVKNHIKKEYSTKIKDLNNRIEQLEKEIQELKSQSVEKLKPVEAFYEIKVGNILEKQFGKDNVKTITDEYGNQWREITINQARDLAEVLLQRNEANQIIGQANIKAMTVLIDAANQKQDTLPHEYAHHYIAWYRNTPIVQEAIKKWGSEEALVQSIGEQVVKQKGEAYNWWNKFVKWIMNQFNSLSKLQKEELTQILTDAFLTRQDIEGSKGFIKTSENLSDGEENSTIFVDNQTHTALNRDEIWENYKEILTAKGITRQDLDGEEDSTIENLIKC